MTKTFTRYEISDGTSHMNILLDSARLKIGQVITLQDADGIWRIDAKHETIPVLKIKRGWKNNI